MVEKFKILTAQHQHRGLRGGARETVIRNFLQDVLPQNVALGSGEVYDVQNSRSSESDVILYDRVRVPLLFSRTSQIFPAESVYAIFEVKSKLDDKGLDDCLTKCANAKLLSKSAFFAMSNQEKNQWSFEAYGKTQENFPILFVVFAYQGIKPTRIINKLETYDRRVAQIDKTIEMIVSLEDEWLICWQGSDGKIDMLPKPGSRRIVINSDRNTLLGFYLLLHRWISQARCPPININKYVKATIGTVICRGAPWPEA